MKRTVSVLSEQVGSQLGLPYHAMLRTSNMSTLPPAARASIHASQDSFVTACQGHARGHNNQTFDSRARHFVRWLEATEFTVNNIRSADPATFPSILASYMHQVLTGHNLLNLQLIGPGALRGCLTSASDAITLLTNHSCSYLDPTTLANKRPKTLPMLGELICRCGAWKEP
jgi:hypothetical protein